MVNSSCQWVRSRLPLWVGDRYGEGQTANADGGDLFPHDRQEIERHLSVCSACRADRAALERVLQALWDSAGQLPLEPMDRSLWPALEPHLAGRQISSRSRNPSSSRPWAEQAGRAWAILDSQRPLRRAWVRDTLREVVRGRVQDFPGTNHRVGWLAVAASVIAFCMVVLTVPMFFQQWRAAQQTIVVNAAPLAQPAPPTIADREALPDTTETTDIADLAAHEVAEADPVTLSDAPPSVPDPTSISKKGHGTRLGYDLEHGASAVPDSRDVKPVY
jgi:hypothetical protein